MAQLNLTELYRAAEDNRFQAFHEAQTASQKRLNNSLTAINNTYRSSVTQAQTAARISALGQEEKLAAAGLNSDSAYSAPTSGYSETARIASDNNLRTNLNHLSAEKLSQEQAARTASGSEISTAYQNYTNGLADIAAQKAQTTVSQYNADRNYNTQLHSQLYSQAVERWQTLGYVLPADAAVLGVAAGTKTSSSAYNDAKLALDRWKTLVKL